MEVEALRTYNTLRSRVMCVQQLGPTVSQFPFRVHRGRASQRGCSSIRGQRLWACCPGRCPKVQIPTRRQPTSDIHPRLTELALCQSEFCWDLTTLSMFWAHGREWQADQPLNPQTEARLGRVVVAVASTGPQPEGQTL